MELKRIIRQVLREETSVSLPITLSGSFKVPSDISNKGDALHSFDRRRSDKFGGYMLTGGPIPSRWSGYVKLNQGKGINQVLRELIDKGIQPDVTDIKITVNNDYSVNWVATIDESSNGKSYYGVGSRGSAGANADSRAMSQISKLKSKNPKYCNWEEVLDLNVTKPIKIRQFFLKYTKCKEDETNINKLKSVSKDSDLEDKIKGWIKSADIGDKVDSLFKYLGIKESRRLREESSVQEKIVKQIDRVGIRRTILSVGGIKNLKKIMGKYDYYTEDVLQQIINYELDELRKESEDWGLGEMVELNQLNAIEELKIVNLVKVNNITITVDIHTNTNRFDFDDIMSELRYRLQKNWNDKILLLEGEIWNTSDYGPGVDW